MSQDAPDQIKISGVGAVVTRGTGVEAWHAVSVAVLSNGVLSHQFGDPHLVTMTRSAIKPFQALPVILSGAADAFGLGQAELAIACSSHNGSDAHVAVVERFLAKIGARPDDLRCGAHLPIAYQLQSRQATHGEDTDPLRHNCSGKHTGFLSVAQHVGQALASYLEADGDVQRRVRAAVAEACGEDAGVLPMGIDGCSAPNYGLSLSALARGADRLASAQAGEGALDAALSRLRDAMLAHPVLVSGQGRLDLALSRAFPNNAVSKGGAEGIQLLAFSEPRVAIAIKIHDGASRALGPVCHSVLEQLGLLTDAARTELAEYAEPEVSNARDRVTGHVRAVLRLSAAG